MISILRNFFCYKCPKCNKKTVPYIQVNFLSPKYCPLCKVKMLPKDVIGAFKRQIFLLALFFIILRVYLWIMDMLEKTSSINKDLSHMVNLILGGILVFFYLRISIICDTQMTEMAEIDDSI